ncbi:hypothetical protein ACVV2G_27460 [Streptomyces ziwulingensis]
MKVSPVPPAYGRETMFSPVRIVSSVAAGAVVAAAAYVWHLSRNDSHGLPSYVALGLTCLALGIGAAAWGTWAARSRLRNPLTQLMAASGALILAVAATSGALLGWAFSVPEGRYARSYGGTDQCLAGTVYASSRVAIKVGRHDTMTAAPSQSGTEQPELHFSHASKGGLSPADKQTRRVLDEHGC